MREAGLEPAWSYPLDPKSSASANFATLADYLDFCYLLKIGAEDGIRTRDIDLGKVALYH